VLIKKLPYLFVYKIKLFQSHVLMLLCLVDSGEKGQSAQLPTTKSSGTLTSSVVLPLQFSTLIENDDVSVQFDSKVAPSRTSDLLLLSVSQQFAVHDFQETPHGFIYIFNKKKSPPGASAGPTFRTDNLRMSGLSWAPPQYQSSSQVTIVHFQKCCFKLQPKLSK